MQQVLSIITIVLALLSAIQGAHPSTAKISGTSTKNGALKASNSVEFSSQNCTQHGTKKRGVNFHG